MYKGYKIGLLALVLIALFLLALAGELKQPTQVSPPATTETEEQSTEPTVRLGNTVVTIGIADTSESRRQGLSGRQTLEEGTGLLFIFEEEGRYGFWMKDMLFSIDIIWFDRSGEIVHIVERAAPESFPMIFEPPTPAYYVLEVPAGFVAKENIALGDIGEFTL